MEPVKPITPQYVDKNIPPPSYEEIMGHQAQSSVKANIPQEQLPPLAYIDIMPRCTNPGNMKGKVPPQYDGFSTLIEAANYWLRANLSYGVWKCETVERKVETSGEVEMDKMIFHESTYGFNVHIRCLRLWLYVRNDPSVPPQQISLLNKVPDKKSIPVAFHGRRMGHMAFFMDDPYFLRTYVHTFTTYEGFEKTIDSLNADLQKSPLQGSILNVESTTIKAAEGFEQLDVDPDSTVFHENGGKLRRYTQIIRVFYVIGTPANENIGYKDFIPNITKKPQNLSPAQFEKFDDLMDRLTKWIPHQTAARVVNIQSNPVRYSELWGDVDIMSDSTDDHDTGFRDRSFLNTLRVFYLTSGKVPPPAPTNYITSKLFLPVRNGRRSFETMSQTMFRIEAWLKVTGIPVHSVETVKFLLREHSTSGVDLTRSNYVCARGTGKYYVTAIRVYFLYPYQEPHPSYLPPVIPWNSKETSSTCTIV